MAGGRWRGESSRGGGGGGGEHLAFPCVTASAAPWLLPSDLRAEPGCAPVLPRGAEHRAPAPRPALPLPLGSPGTEPRVPHGSHLEVGVFSFPLRVGIWEGKESKFHFLDYKFVFLNIVSFL